MRMKSKTAYSGLDLMVLGRRLSFVILHAVWYLCKDSGWQQTPRARK